MTTNRVERIGQSAYAANAPQYKTYIPVVDKDAEDRIFSRSLAAEGFITMTPAEVMSISPGIRKRMHEATAARRVLIPTGDKENIPGSSSKQFDDKPVHDVRCNCGYSSLGGGRSWRRGECRLGSGMASRVCTSCHGRVVYGCKKVE